MPETPSDPEINLNFAWQLVLVAVLIMLSFGKGKTGREGGDNEEPEGGARMPQKRAAKAYKEVFPATSRRRVYRTGHAFSVLKLTLLLSLFHTFRVLGI